MSVVAGRYHNIMHLSRFNKITYGKNTFKYCTSYIWNCTSLYLPESINNGYRMDVCPTLFIVVTTATATHLSFAATPKETEVGGASYIM